MTGITRSKAAGIVAQAIGSNNFSTTYPFKAVDAQDRKWRLVNDGSISCQRVSNGRIVSSDSEHSVELVTPILKYEDMYMLQNVVRALRHGGAFVNESCGIHVHVDASNHNHISLKNLMTIMYSKEDMLFRALNVNPNRVHRYCKKVREPVLADIRKIPNRSLSMDSIKNIWYDGDSNWNVHYHNTRYHALNLHATFTKGTVEFRMFNSTLHAGIVRSYVCLALGMSAQAIEQKSASMNRTVSDNEAFTFRTWLLRMGFIGDEFKNVREHLLTNLEGNKAWRYDKGRYERDNERER